MWCGNNRIRLRITLVWNRSTLGHVGERPDYDLYMQTYAVAWHSFLVTYVRISVSLYLIILDTNNLLRVQRIFF